MNSLLQMSNFCHSKKKETNKNPRHFQLTKETSHILLPFLRQTITLWTSLQTTKFIIFLFNCVYLSFAHVLLKHKRSCIFVKKIILVITKRKKIWIRGHRCHTNVLFTFWECYDNNYVLLTKTVGNVVQRGDWARIPNNKSNPNIAKVKFEKEEKWQYFNVFHLRHNSPSGKQTPLKSLVTDASYGCSANTWANPGAVPITDNLWTSVWCGNCENWHVLPALWDL